MRLWMLWLAALPLSATVVQEVRYKISAGDLMSADAIADEFCRASGPNSECAAAVAWSCRGFRLCRWPRRGGFLPSRKFRRQSAGES